MSKSMNMLRTRRRDNNVKPNRRLDRKSSRGMIYENEELRLKTININAEIERGQSDIKKLRRENELLKKEIWYLRDEYEKLDKLLKLKEDDYTSSSSTCSSDSEQSSEEKEVETSQNIENIELVQKTNMKSYQVEFDHLSVVPEEPSTENSDKSRTSIHETGLEDAPDDAGGILPPDQGYPGFPMTKHFFAPLPQRPLTPPQAPHFYTFRNEGSPSREQDAPGPSKPDLIVKTDNRGFEERAGDPMTHLGCLDKLDPMQMLEVEHFEAQRGYAGVVPRAYDQEEATTTQRFNGMSQASFPRSSFSNGGNLEELLNDIQTISEDIYKISNPNMGPEYPNGHMEGMGGHFPLEQSSFNGNVQSLDRLIDPPGGQGRSPDGASQETLESKDLDKYKSEISVVLMPTPMPLLGFEKYQNLSSDKLDFLPTAEPELDIDLGRLELSNSSDQLTSDVDAKPNGLRTSNEDVKRCDDKEKDKDKKKLSIRRKVSIHFKGRKDKDKDKDKDEDGGKAGTKRLRPPALTISSAPSSAAHEDSAHASNSKDAAPQTAPATLPSLLAPRAETPCVSPAPPPPPLSVTAQHNPKDSSDSERPVSGSKHNHNKSTSASPERHDGAKKHHKHKKKRKLGGGMAGYLKQRRNTLSTEQMQRERSASICTDRGPYMTDDYLPSSERERTNSLSSCGTNAERNRRKFSTISRIPSGTGGKIPWCACWGNGCL